MSRRASGLVAAGAACLLGVAAHAQEPAADAADETVELELGPFGVTAPAPRDATPRWRLHTAAPLRARLVPSGRTLLEADRAVIWVGAGRAGGAAPVLPGLTFALRDCVVYAEGHVRFAPGPDRTFTAERMLVDFGLGRAQLLVARLTVERAVGERPLVLAAEAMRVRYSPAGGSAADASDSVEADGVAVGTCEFGHPHYAVRAARARLTGAIRRRALGDSESTEWLTLRGLTAEVLGVPVLWWPGLSWNLDWDSPIRAFEAGSSRATGPFLRTLLGVTLREAVTRDDGRVERRRVGEAGVRLEGFGLRGWGAGAEARWHGHHVGADRDAFGDRPRALDLESLAIGWVDHGDPRDADAPPGLWPVPRDDRGRAHAFARYAGLEGWRVTGETHWLSDRNVLRELAEQVRLEAKEPETFAETLVHWGPLAAGLLARPRLNDFQTQTEYLPRLRALGWGIPLLGPSALSLAGELANVRRSFDEATGLRPYRAGRADGQATLDVRPLDLWAPLGDRLALLVSGFARYSAWSRDAGARGGTDRFAYGGAMVLRTEWHRVFGEGADRWRHAIAPELRWEGVTDVNRDPVALRVFDDVESLRPVERVTARLRTAVQVPDGSGHRDWLFAEVTGAWFPRPHRDNGGKRSGDATGELRFAPRVGDHVWSLWARGTWRMADERVTAWEAGARIVDLLPGLSFALASVNAVDSVHTLAFTADWRWSARWGAGGQARYDLERGRPEATRVVLRRVWHCWVLEAGVSVDHGRDDVTAIVSLLPLGLGDGAGPFARRGAESTLGIEQR